MTITGVIPNNNPHLKIGEDVMTNTKELVAKRKEAYEFIWRKLKNFLSTWGITSDKTLASTLDVSLEEIVSLKEGRTNPTQRLIKGIINLFDKEVTKEEIDIYFVRPFK